MPKLYIISGCNGAGKTTASFTFLPEIFNCREYVNADEIAKGLSPFQPEKVAFQAGRIMLKRIDELLNSNIDFAFETTLSTKSYRNLIAKAKKQGYAVTLLYLWLNSPELAIERVKERVKNGGHSIPELTIRTRYFKGINNLKTIFVPLVDYWMVVDNSGSVPDFIAEAGANQQADIYNKDVYSKIFEK